MSIPRAYFWHLPFCCFENAPLWDRSQGTKQKLQRLKVCFNGQALIGVLHDPVFPLFIYLFIYLFVVYGLFTLHYIHMSVFLFTTFLKERFTSKQNMKWQDEMISFLLLLVLLLLLFLLLLLLLSFITCSKYFSSFYWLNPWLIIYNQIALTKFGRRLRDLI